jgi:hypothetical protein
MSRLALSRVALVMLLAATTSHVFAQVGQGSEPAAMHPAAMAVGPRLSGVVAVGGEARLAVLEIPGRGGRLVRVGDTLSDGSRVTAMGLDWVRLAGRDGERLIRLEGAGDAPVAYETRSTPGRSDASGSADHPDGPGMGAAEESGPKMLILEPELQELIDGVAVTQGASVESLADVIGAFHGWPADAEIAISDLSFNPFPDAAAVKAALEEAGMVRVRVGSGEGERMHYLGARPEVPPGDENEQSVPQ